MNVGILVLLALIVSLGVLFVAVMAIRHQRLLSEKKAQYLSCMKEKNYHQRRYQACQSDIDRLRGSYNTRLREINLIVMEVDNKKKEIKEILEILKSESRGVDDQMEQDLTRIIERRKSMLQKLWKVYNGMKAKYLEKIVQASNDVNNMESYISKKDNEFKKWHEYELRIKKLKKEYNQMVRNPIISFGRKRT